MFYMTNGKLYGLYPAGWLMMKFKFEFYRTAKNVWLTNNLTASKSNRVSEELVLLQRL